MKDIKVKRMGDWVMLEVCANAFLYHMVRSIVGALRMVGSGQWNAEMMMEVLESCDRARCGTLAPPHGLKLVEVKY